MCSITAQKLTLIYNYFFSFASVRLNSCAIQMYCATNYLVQMSNSNFCVLDNWSAKAKRRNTTGTGRMRHLKRVYRRFRYDVLLQTSVM